MEKEEIYCICTNLVRVRDVMLFLSFLYTGPEGGINQTEYTQIKAILQQWEDALAKRIDEWECDAARHE